MIRYSLFNKLRKAGISFSIRLAAFQVSGGLAPDILDAPKTKEPDMICLF
jgi:hypothetical protein